MSCVTCEVPAPPERSGPRLGAHHVAGRFGDAMTLGLAVLFRGYDVTLQCVEAVAGPDGDEVDPETGRVVTPAGWVEMRLMDSDGHVRFHPPSEEHAAHVVTVVREGRVQIVRGTNVINEGGLSHLARVARDLEAAED